VFGNNGLFESMPRGSIIAVSSTAKPDNMKALAERVAVNGIEVMDAPICRGRFAADSGTLLAWSVASPKSSNALGRSTPPSPRTSYISARSGTARSAKQSIT